MTPTDAVRRCQLTFQLHRFVILAVIFPSKPPFSATRSTVFSRLRRFSCGLCRFYVAERRTSIRPAGEKGGRFVNLDVIRNRRRTRSLSSCSQRRMKRRRAADLTKRPPFSADGRRRRQKTFLNYGSSLPFSVRRPTPTVGNRLRSVSQNFCRQKRFPVCQKTAVFTDSAASAASTAYICLSVRPSLLKGERMLMRRCLEDRRK